MVLAGKLRSITLWWAVAGRLKEAKIRSRWVSGMMGDRMKKATASMDFEWKEGR